MGLPSTGIFGLYDLIGYDVMKLISSSLLASLLANDAYHKIICKRSLFLIRCIEKQLIGRKGDGGFYRLSVSNGKKIKEVININDLSYSPVQKVDILILMRFL